MGSDVQFHASLILFPTFDLIANLVDVLSAFRIAAAFAIRPFATYDSKRDLIRCAIDKSWWRCAGRSFERCQIGLRTDNLNEAAQRIVEILQIGEQLRHGWPIPGGIEPAGFHTGEELIGTRPRLCETISVSETRHHLERVHFYIRLLTQCRQLPQENSEGPLGSKENILLDIHEIVFLYRMIWYKTVIFILQSQ